MDMIYAVIKNGIVENVIIWDGETSYAPPDGFVLVKTETAGIGWSYDSETGVFTRPIDPAIEALPE